MCLFRNTEHEVNYKGLPVRFSYFFRSLAFLSSRFAAGHETRSFGEAHSPRPVGEPAGLLITILISVLACLTCLLACLLTRFVPFYFPASFCSFTFRPLLPVGSSSSHLCEPQFLSILRAGNTTDFRQKNSSRGRRHARRGVPTKPSCIDYELLRVCATINEHMCTVHVG